MADLGANADEDHVLPDYRGRCLTNVMPALTGVSPWPDWMPGQRPEVAVVFLFDGLGARMLEAYRQRAPTMSSMTNVTLTTVAPSTTAAALTSFTTGSAPGEHGIIGYRMSIDVGIINSLRWTIEGADARSRVSSEALQPVPPFAALPTAVVSPSEHAGSGFTLAHLRGATYVGFDDLGEIPDLVTGLVDSGERLVYVYHDGLDRVGHVFGLGDEYGDELARCDGLVGEVLGAISSDAATFVTADHGMVECNTPIALRREVTDLVDHQSGEARFRWLHARDDNADRLLETALKFHADTALVWSRAEVLERNLLGPVGVGGAERIGDVALIARGTHCFADPSDSTPAELVGRHGGLSADEMLIPLLRG